MTPHSIDPDNLSDPSAEIWEAIAQRLSDFEPPSEHDTPPYDLPALLELVRDGIDDLLDHPTTPPRDMTAGQLDAYRAVLNKRILDWGGPEKWSVTYEIHGASLCFSHISEDIYFYATPLHEAESEDGSTEDLPVQLHRGPDTSYADMFTIHTRWSGSVDDDLRRFKTKVRTILRIIGMSEER